MVASDKLFFWLFQYHADRILSLVADLPPDAAGYTFSAPVLKEREHRLDGLFLPPPHRPDLPALILEAQMAADPGFLLRLYAETARLLQQQARPLQHWRVVVFCPSRQLRFGDPRPVKEFLEQRVIWIELLPDRLPPEAPPLQRALAMLLLPEHQLPVCSVAIRRQFADTPLAPEIDDVIAAILMARFTGRSIREICAMGGITLEDFTQSVAYREIYGHGREEGREQGRQAEAAALSLRLLRRRCGDLLPDQQARVQALSLPQLEALADALLDFRDTGDLNVWLATQP